MYFPADESHIKMNNYCRHVVRIAFNSLKPKDPDEKITLTTSSKGKISDLGC